MNKIEKNKKTLVGLSIGITVIGVIALIVGIILAVFGGKGLGGTGSKVGSIIELIFGIILILGGIVGAIVGVIFAWTGSSLKATQGSIAEENLAKGTVNMKKCVICGSEISGDEQFCSQCGNRTDGKITCKNCGNLNNAGSKCCSNCGKDL